MTSQASDLYVSALRNTHAMELQALQIMQRQLDRLERYPAVSELLKIHIDETHTQRDRLERALERLGSKPSTLKEGLLGFVGNMMALGHTPASDEILKNMFANQAFENFEIAAYRSLIVLAQGAGAAEDVRALEISLSEEEAMAKRVAELVPATTRQYVDLTLSGEKADR